MGHKAIQYAQFALIAIVVMTWTLTPIYHLLVVSLTPVQDSFAGKLWPDRPTLDNYVTVLTQGDYYLTNFWRQMANSIFAAIMTCALVLFIAVLASYVIGRMRVRFGGVVSNLALLTYLIPAAFLAIPFYQVMGVYQLLDSIWAMILAVTTFTAPYAIWVLRQYGDSVPRELDEAAKIDGATPLQILYMVYIPLITPAMIAIGSFALLHAWNEYLYAFLLLNDETRMTVPIALGYYASDDDSPWPVVMAMGLIYSLPPALLYYSVRKYMASGLTSGGVKS